jgi:hypothetical protein
MRKVEAFHAPVTSHPLWCRCRAASLNPAPRSFDQFANAPSTFDAAADISTQYPPKEIT